MADTLKHDFSLIIWGNVHNSKTAEMMKVFSKEKIEIIVIKKHEASSCSQAYNMGTDRAKGKYLVYAHETLEILDKSLFYKIRQTFLKHPKVGVIGVAGNVDGSDKSVWSENHHSCLRGGFVKGRQVVNYGKYQGEAKLLEGCLLAFKAKHNFPESIKDIEYMSSWMCKIIEKEGEKCYIIESDTAFTPPVTPPEVQTLDKDKYLRKWFLAEAMHQIHNAKVHNQEFLNKYDGAHSYKNLSIVIAVHNQWEYTKHCIDSLLTDVPEAEVIVVDNGSTDDTQKGLTQYKNVKVIRFDKNQGVPKAWNAGLSIARGDILGVLNNDTRINQNGMKALAHAAAENGISAYQGGVLNDKMEFAGYTTNAEFSDYPNGCCVLFRRDVWRTVGKYDEIYSPAYFEDSDWGVRARLAGFKWVFVPESIQHFMAKTSQFVPVDLGRNLKIFQEKWAGTGLGKKVMVKRMGAVGDVFMSTPALQSLREKYPLAKIHLVTGMPAIWQGLESVDYVSNRPEWHYTDVFVLDGAYEKYRAQDIYFPATSAFAEALNVDLKVAHYAHAPIPDTIKEWATKTVTGRENLIAVGLRSGTRSYSNWDDAKWFGLFTENPHLTFVLFDTDKDPNVNVNNKDHSTDLYSAPNVLNLTGQTPSVLHVLSVMEHCRACVSVDTGVVHMANAVQIPVIGLFGGEPSWARVPLKGKFFALQGSAPCFPCNCVSACVRKQKEHCLEWVQPRHVSDLLKRL